MNPTAEDAPKVARSRRYAALIAGLAALLGGVTAAPGQSHSKPFHQDEAAHAEIEGFLVDFDDAPGVRRRLDTGDPALAAALETLLAEAEKAMEVPIRPVTEGKDKPSRVAPTGDRRDYVSLSPYWWPNPETEDGLPYVRRDGRVNPERHEYDTPKLGDMSKAVRTLGFAYHVTGDERYAARAARHLRVWFIDPETRMNPNLRFAQFVPGVSDGRHVGIIDTNRLRWVPDAILMISPSEAWSSADMAGARRWFSEFVDWMLTSELGREERAAKNNHGTWFASQAALYALFAGRDEVAREMVNSAFERVDAQIEPDGSQPHELTRTRALDYCEFNVRGLLDLGEYGRRLDIDLLGYETEDGRSIRAALAFLIPYFTGAEAWPYEQISPPKTHMYYQTLRRAARLYDDPAYERAIGAMPEVTGDIVWVELILPARHGTTTTPSTDHR